jgi:hypothetical protein
MLLGVTSANARSRFSTPLDSSTAEIELGIIFDRVRGKALQSRWSVKPIQKYSVPSEQFLAITEPTADSKDVMAPETAL